MRRRKKLIEKLINFSGEVRNIKVNKKDILEVTYGILKSIRRVQKKAERGK